MSRRHRRIYRDRRPERRYSSNRRLIRLQDPGADLFRNVAPSHLISRPYQWRGVTPQGPPSVYTPPSRDLSSKGLLRAKNFEQVVKMSVCAKRHARKQILFAKRIAGRRGVGGGKHGPDSQISC